MSEKSAPPAPTETVAQLWAMFDRGDFLEMARRAEEAVARYPESADLWAIQAHCLLWSGRRDEAHAALQKAQHAGPDSAMALASEAQVAAFEGCAEEAMERAARALRLDDANRWVLQWASGAFGGAGDYETALQLVERARTLYPEEPHWAAAVVPLLSSAGRRQESDRALAEGEARFPDYHRLWAYRALSLTRDERLQEAAALLRRATSAAPGSAFCWGEFALVLSHLQQADEAEAAARQALEISACSPSAMTAMAHVCRLRGDKAGAAEWERQAAEAVPALSFVQHVRAANQALKRQNWYGVLDSIQPALAARSAIMRQIASGIEIRALLALRRIGPAEERLQALEQSGYDTHVLYELKTQARLVRRDRAGAMALCREGVQRCPGSGTLRAQLLRLLRKRSLWDSLFRRETVAAAEQEAQALVVHLLQYPPEIPSQIVAACAAMWDTGYRDEARQLRALGERRFPGAREFRILNALARIDLRDFRGAREVVDEV